MMPNSPTVQETELQEDVAVTPNRAVKYERHEIPIKSLLAEALIKTPLERGYKRDARRQIQILEGVPDELAQIIYGDIMKKDEESRLFHRKSGTLDRYTPIAPEEVRGHVQGKLFEILVGHDKKLAEDAKLGSAILVNGDMEDADNTITEETSAVRNAGNEILAAVDNPQRFRFSDKVLERINENGYNKIPDDAFIFIDENTRKITIKGIGEVKSGKLSSNAIKQLSGNSVKSTRAVVNQLKSLSPGELEEAGMEYLAQKVSEGYSIDISDNPKQILILPAAVKHDTPEDIYKLALDSRDQVPLTELLLQSENLSVINGAFSRQEIGAMVDVIHERIVYWMNEAKKYQQESISTIQNTPSIPANLGNQEKQEIGTSILEFFDVMPETLEQIKNQFRRQIEQMVPPEKRADRTKEIPSEAELEQESKLALLDEMSPDDVFTAWFLNLEVASVSKNKMKEEINKYGGEQEFYKLIKETAEYYQMFNAGSNFATQEVVDPVIKAIVEREEDRPEGVYDQLVYIDMAKDYFKTVTATPSK